MAVLLVVAAGLSGCSDDEAGEPVSAGPCSALGGLAATSAADGAGGAEGSGGSGGGDGTGDGTEAGDEPVDVLVFTRTTGFRHTSIDPAIEWFESLEDEGVRATATEDPSAFTAEGLADYDVVAFVSTTGDVLDDSQQAAFEEWVQAGGGFVGVHAAADTEYEWAWYGNELVGAWFTSHPPLVQTVTLTTEAPDDPTVAHFDETWTFTEEWYNVDRNPRLTSDVLLSLDEATATMATGGPVGDAFTMGGDHPVAWSHQVGDGRSWYTNLGHLDGTWADPDFNTHVLEGVRWAASPERTRRSVIVDDLEAPIALEVADSGLVLWTERSGEVELWDPATGEVRRAATLPTRVEGEGGVLGIRLAPDAAETGHVYTYATTPVDDDLDAENVLVRHTLAADCTFDPAEGEVLLRVPTQLAGHQAGDIQFLGDGTLLLATGDDTANVDDGYAPLDDTGDPVTADARRTSGNPDDLRGKILRINADGSIPDGNLYPDDGSAGRPEVYVTGARNPYRLVVEPGTDRIWWGDIGPDAVLPGDRGPQGFDELNVSDGPGDHGWPFCIADNTAYHELDAATGEIGEPYDCEPMVGAVLAYDYTTLVHPVLGLGVQTTPEGEVELLGRSMMAGTWYDPGDGAAAALDEHDVLLLHEFARNLLLVATIDDDGGLAGLRRLAPWTGVNTPIDVETGPDGALYILEYGQWNSNSQGSPILTRLEGSATGAFPELPETVRVDERVEFSGSGEAVFGRYCSTCHAVDGSGAVGPSLLDVGDRLDHDEIVAIVTDGRGRMPGWSDVLTEEEIDAVATFVATLTTE